jgi:SMP-30/Gluconolactonase/LRE-like region
MRPLLLLVGLTLGCGEGDRAPPSPAAGCDRAPSFPAAFTTIKGPPASEDFTFDSEGYLLALENGRSLVRTARAALPTLVAPNVVANGRGLRALPGGDVVIADLDRSLLVRVDRDGGVRRLTTEIPFPNGLALGPGGKLFVTDFGMSGDVFRVDPDSGEAVALVRPSPGSNGIAFSPDYRILYIGDHDAGSLYRTAVAADGQLALPERWVDGIGTPDGLTTDRCGNVYAASWDRRVYRVSASGTVDVVVELPGTVSAVSFGSGKQGWKAESLYVMAIQEGGVHEIDLGRESAPAPPP